MYHKCGSLEASGTEGVGCLRMHVYVRVCTHICIYSIKMVRFIFIKPSACFPSVKMGCESCQRYVLSPLWP